jgi:two-component system chemotaxis response regulator CheY
MKSADVKKLVLKTPKPEGWDAQDRPVKVLVVDDEIIVRKLVTQVLKSAGYEIAGEAGDGKRALDMYRMRHPDIVTLDVQMPVMDGFQALEQILQADSKALVVMLTNLMDKETVTKIIQAGARDYIVKPIDRKLILAKLRKLRGIPY